MQSAKLLVAVIQLDSQPDVAGNFARIERLLPQCAGADLVALPEVFAWRGAGAGYRTVAEPLGGPICVRIGALAARTQAWVLAGSIAEADQGRIYNTSVLFRPTGAIAAAYRKLHLFDPAFEREPSLRESAVYAAGDSPVLTAVGGWPAGLSVCYDLRFPELYRHLGALGAELLCVPSDFTRLTGRDHWETLVRARAIENQCYVIAPNQCGVNAATGVASHGHSLLVDPWGTILAEGSAEDEGVLRAEFDREALLTIRRQLPALTHRRL